MLRIILTVLMILIPGLSMALDLIVTDEFRRIDPFGKVIEKDGKSQTLLKDGVVQLTAAAGGYASFQLGIVPGQEATIYITPAFADQGVEVDLFRAWFHENKEETIWYPGALIPVKTDDALSCPASDNKIAGQTSVTVWVDIWIPAALAGGILKGGIKIEAAGENAELAVEIVTGPNALPAEDGLEMDHNTYGVGWIFKLVPEYARTIGGFRESYEYNKVLHDTYRLLYEHRGRLHNLGYNHNGYVQPIFAPQLTGEGADKRIISWEKFDRRFGPLLDGSAFKNTRRGPYPVPGIYLTINPEWPASMANWGTPAYDAAFTNIVAAMEKHFKAKGWVNTRFEMFFNHKKRYKAFSWDGDETKFTRDNPFFHYYGKLLRKAVPVDSPVTFVFRHDASWQLKNQVDELKGVVDHWILSGGCSNLYPEVFPELQKRGDVIWVYGGLPSMWDPSAAILKMAAQAWMKGAHGFEHWLFSNPGSDPWFNCDGANTGVVFSGEKFGIRGPIPCIRLKIQRNFLQDIALAKGLHGFDESAAKAAALAGLKRADWFVASRPALLDRDPKEWNNPDIGEAAKVKASEKEINADWELKLRAALLAADKQTLKPVAPALKDPAPLKKAFLESNVKAMRDLADAASEEISGAAAAAIMTEWGAEKMFNVDPRDKWAGGDNFDVHHKKYDKMKKKLIHLSRRLPFKADCNLWVICRNNKKKVQLLIRQLNGITPGYQWGQLYMDPTEDMQKCLKGEVVAQDAKNFTAFLAPIKDAQGNVTGFVQIAARTRDIE